MMANAGLMSHHHSHSLWFQWFFEVSKTVGGFALTGLLGFVVVKKLKLQERKVSDVPWREFGGLSTVVIAFTIGGMGTLALASKGDYVSAVALPILLLLGGGAVHFLTWRVKMWFLNRGA